MAKLTSFCFTASLDARHGHAREATGSPNAASMATPMATPDRGMSSRRATASLTCRLHTCPPQSLISASRVRLASTKFAIMTIFHCQNLPKVLDTTQSPS
ncbi:uncharacterized protein TrAtP1_005094 [Trichoderma atroviride]|uniref:uncharacterized protein n=1 Tax=Hypocrea atroviridis TaxID=63577 RepID=UPI003328BC00|nr:hypothetical protein TrAtP1_005094 [Trichoderma atroviride]